MIRNTAQCRTAGVVLPFLVDRSLNSPVKYLATMHTEQEKSPEGPRNFLNAKRRADFSTLAIE